MHPFLLPLFVGLSSFWDDATRVQRLADPPSSKFLKQIQQEPWRGGLEPIPTDGIPLQEAIVIEGEIPFDLRGVLCRNGPGRIRIGDTQYGHWFDGDGVVSKLYIDGEAQTATFMAKYVETERFRQQQKIEQRTGDVPMATGGAWTKKGRGGFLENLFGIPTNPSNTNVIFLNDEKDSSKPRLFALAEGGNPVEIDPKTLKTKETKAFKSKSGEETKSFFSAHYKKDPITGQVFNHGIALGAKILVNVMKFSSTGELLKQSPCELPFVCFVHDSIMTEKHFLLLVLPYQCPPSSLLTSAMGGKPLGQQLEWNPQNVNESMALVFSKDTLECLAQVPLPLLSSYHQIDAFEDPSDSSRISFRVLAHHPSNSRVQLEEGFKDLYSHSRVPICQFMQYTINIKTQKCLDSRRIAPNAGLCELPTINSDWKDSHKRYVWTNTRTEGAGYLNSLQKVDLETGECSDLISFGETTYAGNPIFVPKANPQKEDDGYILSQLYRSDEHRSDIVILDAATMQQLTLLQLNTHITYQFHGEWYAGLL